MPRPSDFTDADEEYLKSQYAQYRRTPGSEKEAFRVLCAKHVMRSCDLDLEHIYTLDLFNTKVRNWFQNNAPMKKVRLPMHINNTFHPEWVWGMMHQDEIRNSLQESPPEDADDDTPYVVLWNARRKVMWMELPAEEKVVYQRLAEEWSENGPDDDLKPQFDTSLLFEGSDEWKGKLTFRSSKDWATDFRRYFYEFFTAYILPDLASPESMEYLRTTSKRVVEPCEFERTEEGWPLLPEGAGCDTLRRQEILRLFLRELYGFACGREVLSVPWSSLLKLSDKFFEPGMLPQDFTLGDPSKISCKPLKRLFDHIRKIQEGSMDGIPRFQFSNYETSPEGNRQYPIALNSTDMTPWQPRRSKKKVQPLTFDAAPGNTDAEDDGDDEDDEDTPPAPKKTGRRRRFNPGKKFYRDVEKLRKEKERANARKKKAEAKAAAKAAKGKAKAGARKSRKSKGKKNAAVDTDDDVWNSDQAETPEDEEIDDFEAIDNDVPEDDSEESDGERHRARTRSIPGAASDESNDEVEEALERYEDVLSASAVRKSVSQVAGPSGAAGESASGMRASSQQNVEGQSLRARKSANKGLPDTMVSDSPPPLPVNDAERIDIGQALRPTTEEALTRAVDESPQTVIDRDVIISARSISTKTSSVGATENVTAAVTEKVTTSSAPGRKASRGDARSNADGVTPPAYSHTQPSSNADRPAADGIPSSARTTDAPNPTSPPLTSPPLAIAETSSHGASASSAAVADWAPPTTPVASASTAWALVDLAPTDVPADGSARFQYLQGLDGEKAYQDMLTRGSEMLSQTSPIRMQPPLFWASWGHKSPYLPKDAHTVEKGPRTLQSLLKFLKKGLPATCGPANAQRYCLVMGVTLKTIMALQMVEPGEEWPAHLPRYMETSTITFDLREPLLSACATVFKRADPNTAPTLPTDGGPVATTSDAQAAEAADIPQRSSGTAAEDPDPSEPPMRAPRKPRRGRTGAAAKGSRTPSARNDDQAVATAAARPPDGGAAGARRSSRLRK